MELNAVMAYGALPALLLGASVVLSHAYNRLQARFGRSERDRRSYLEVLEGSNDALFVINFVNGRIYQANERAAALLGYTRSEFNGLTIFQLHPKELLRLSAERIADAWQQKGLIYDDIPLLSATGERIPVECSTRVTSYRGNPAIILFARDIRERIALQCQVEEQQALVREQNRDLLASIRYAQRIQRAVLPEADKLQDLFPGSFILFRPRDIVSGDLYWFAEHDRRAIVAAADCTGHGVPGALLSLIGASLFHEAVIEKGIDAPAEILNTAREGMVQALNRPDNDTDQHDGMNVALVSIDPQAMTLSFAGALAPLYLLRKGELIEFKGDRMPVGLHASGAAPFTQHEQALGPGDRIYLFSDGLQDQFGGPEGRKLRSAGLKAWIRETGALSMGDQHQALSDRFRMWKADLEQVDDVLLIGIEV